MKVYVEYASDTDDTTSKTVELDNTITDLLKLMEKEGSELIIKQSKMESHDLCILVYDDWVE